MSWSGGLDSTYIVMKYVMSGETVQPFTLLWDQPHLYSRIKKAQDFFINLYPNNILKPEFFEVKDLQKRINSSDIIVHLDDFEKKIIQNHEITYKEIYSINKLDRFFLKNSRNETFTFKNYEKPYEEIMYQYYWPVFHTDNKYFIDKIDNSKQCFAKWNYYFQNFLIYPIIYLSNLLNVPIDIGMHSTITGTKPIKKWIGIDENFRIKNDIYRELTIAENVRFPLAFITKTDLVRDLLDIDIELLALLVDNCCTCLVPTSKGNYCNNCICCRSMRRTKAHYYSNLYKINKKNYDLLKKIV